MRTMFGLGFEKEVFSERHPELGLSVSQLQTWWRDWYPKAKEELKPLATQPIPGTVPVVPRVPPPPPPSSGPSTALVLGGLGVLGLGAYYLLAKKPFGIKK